MKYRITVTFLLSKFFILLVGCLCLSKNLLAQSFLYPGIQPMLESGQSQTNTSGAAATMWNPGAILSSDDEPTDAVVDSHKETVMEKTKDSPTTKRSNRSRVKSKKRGKHSLYPYGDVSLVNINYSYQRSGYGPTRIALTVPPVNLGIAWQPQSKLALGFLLVPRPALQSQLIENLPYEQSAKVILVNADQKAATFISAIGAAYKVQPRLSLGLSLIETAEDITFSAIPADDASGIPLLQSSAKVSVYQFVLGAKFQIDSDSLLGLSFKTAAVKKYQGSVSVSGSSPEDTQKSDYIPSRFAVGYERNFEDKTLFGELRRDAWASGRSQFHSESPTGATSKDYKDVMSFTIGGRYKFQKSLIASGSFGLFPNNVGNGSAFDDRGNNTGDELVAGTEFGNFDALDRQIISGSLKQQKTNGYLMGGFNYQTASRQVSSTYLGGGKYTLNVITLAIGVSRSF